MTRRAAGAWAIPRRPRPVDPVDAPSRMEVRVSAFAAPQPRRSADRQFLPVAPGSLTEAPTARTMLRRSRGALALGAVLAALATWYGFLEAAGGHPSLKLGGAMALAGA